MADIFYDRLDIFKALFSLLFYTTSYYFTRFWVDW